MIRTPSPIAPAANAAIGKQIEPNAPPEIQTLSTRQSMKQITIKLTIKELEVLTSLASDQVFRREFIDPKMPGYRTNAEELGLSKNLVGRLRALIKSGWENQTHPAGVAG